MTESKEKRWIKIRLFTSTWKIWHEFKTIEKNYDKDLDSILEVNEVEEHENPVVLFERDIHGFTHTNGVYYELIAIVPQSDKQKIINIWKEILQENLSGVEILERLLDYISEYDSTPIVSFYQDSDKISIEIN